MHKSKSSPLADPKDFFSEELRAVLEKQQLVIQKEPFDYVVDLLCRYLKSDAFFSTGPDGKLEHNVLAALYSEYIQGNTETQRITLRRLGDVCLLVTGFFADSLKRKLNDVDYYFGMGGSAYLRLSQMQMTQGTRSLFKEMAVKFRTFANVLEEMSERSGLQSNTDILRLYEKWLLTGSDRLKTLLAEKGLSAPVRLNVKVKH